MTFTDKFDWYRSLAGADITDTEFRVLVLLANYADGKTGQRAHPSAATLATQTGKSDKTVRRALAALVEKGWLVKSERSGSSTVYGLTTPTLDTQMSRVTDPDPGHPDVQGVQPTLDISDTTLDTQVSTPPGHLDVHRSDQGSDPLRIRSVNRGSDPFGQDIGDVHPDPFSDETGLGSRSLAVEGRAEAPEGADGRGQEGPSLVGRASGTAVGAASLSAARADPWGSVPEPATATEGFDWSQYDHGEDRDMSAKAKRIRAHVPIWRS